MTRAPIAIKCPLCNSTLRLCGQNIGTDKQIFWYSCLGCSIETPVRHSAGEAYEIAAKYADNRLWENFNE